MVSSKHLLNVFLRGTTLAARFLFVFFLAKYLNEKDVGYYGLFTATVGYFLYFVGLDFYTYTTREIIKAHVDERGRMIKGQITLSAWLYLFVLPFAALFLPQAGWPQNLVLWFFPILFLEHLNQEISRLLTALSEQIAASYILFMRQGSWALVIVCLMAMNTKTRDLHTIMACWMVASLVAAGFGIRKIRQLNFGGWHQKTDWTWVRRGVKISTAFLLATLALRGVQTADRYWIEALSGIEIVGAYILFFGVASTLMVFLDAGVFSFAYPELVNLHHRQQHAQARKKVIWLLVYVMAASAVFGICSWFLLPYLLNWIGKSIYVQSLYLYPWLLLATVLNALGLVVHFALYAQGKDRHIIGSHIAASVVFAASTWLMSQSLPGIAVPVGLCIFFAVILLWKALAYLLSASSKRTMAATS